MFTIKFYSVKNYGAVGDKKTDDTKSIQKAIDAASTVCTIRSLFRCFAIIALCCLAGSSDANFASFMAARPASSSFLLIDGSGSFLLINGGTDRLFID